MNGNVTGAPAAPGSGLESAEQKSSDGSEADDSLPEKQDVEIPFTTLIRSRRMHRYKRVGHRVLSKRGESKVALINVPGKHKRYAQDFFNTLVECRWRYTLLLFFLSHVISWFLFALLWYLMAAAHGDLNGQLQEDELPCVVNMRDFTACFLFSLESQTTIGYGTSYLSKECPEAVFLLSTQSIFGLIIQAVTVGIVFSKMTRPQLRTQTLLFSRNAVIAMRDGCFTLQFRVADIRKSLIVGAKLSVHLRRAKTTLEGDVLEMDQTELDVHFDGSAKVLHLVWPTTVVHRIDQNSPLYNLSPYAMRAENFEVLVFLEGTIQATGQTTQAKTSYAPSEVLWGQKFVPMVKYSKETHRYEADYKRFHETARAETPQFSASYLDRLRSADSPTTPSPDAAPSAKGDGFSYPRLDRKVQFVSWSEPQTPTSPPGSPVSPGSKSMFSSMYTSGNR